MNKIRKAYQSLTESVVTALYFGHTSLNQKLICPVAEAYPGVNTWDEHIVFNLESKFDHFVDNILDDELRLKLEHSV